MFIKLIAFFILCPKVIEMHISIQIDQEDLPQIGDILQTVIINNNQHIPFVSRLPSRMIRICTKTITGVVQLFGIMVTLVASNLLTNKLETLWIDQPTDFNVNPVEFNLTTTTASSVSEIENFVIPETCNYDFGCNSKLCYRTCNETIVQYQTTSWCYTTSDKSNSKTYQACRNAQDCSPCWKCAGPCV